MNPPQRVEATGIPYSVECKPLKKTTLGHFLPAKQAIELNTLQGPESMRSALMEEVVHVCFYHAGLRQTYGCKQEEAIVSPVALLLFDVLKRNPRLVSFLFEKP